MATFQAPDTTAPSKFQIGKELLWRHFSDENSQVKLVLLLNKRDCFHEKLKVVPLHTTPHFSSVRPKGEFESHEDYCKRCEENVVEFFASVVRSKDGEQSGGCGYLVGMKEYQFTTAVDQESFSNVAPKLLKIFEEQV